MMTLPDDRKFNSQDNYMREDGNIRGKSSSVELLDAFRLVAQELNNVIIFLEQFRNIIRKDKKLASCSRQIKKRRCYECRLRGHYRKECPLLQPREGEMKKVLGYSSNVNKTIMCYGCK